MSAGTGFVESEEKSMVTRLIALTTTAPLAVPFTGLLVVGLRPRCTESGFAGRCAPISRELTRPPDRC